MRNRPSDQVVIFVAGQAILAGVLFLFVASQPAPVQTPASTLRFVVVAFVWAVAAVGAESHNEAVRAGHVSDEGPIDSCGMILLIPAFLLAGGHAVEVGIPFAFILWRVMRKPLFKLFHELAATVLKVAVAAFVAARLSIPGVVVDRRFFEALFVAAVALWLVEVTSNATLAYLEDGRLNVKTIRGSARTASRFMGVSAAFMILYFIFPIFTLGALPLVALVYSEQRIRFLANRDHTDDKTGLATSGTFNSRIVTEIRRAERTGKPVSLVVVDLDNFKSVNTRFGHLGGDAALEHISRALVDFSRRTDLVARWGGDELVWLMPGCPLWAAANAAEGLRRRIADTSFILSGQVASLTVSIGVASWHPEMNPSDLFGRADAALYRSKEGGRNMCTIDGASAPHGPLGSPYSPSTYRASEPPDVEVA
jgi:diguanylate cyclase (GGDEF)-like protein